MDQLNSLWEQFAEGVLSLLPLSPFREYLDYMADLPHLGVLNWFFPFRGVLVITGTWLTAVGLFYGYSVVMRWIKIIGD